MKQTTYVEPHPWSEGCCHDPGCATELEHELALKHEHVFNGVQVHVDEPPKTRREGRGA